MKLTAKYLLIVCLVLGVQSAFSQEKKLKAYLDLKQYYSPEVGNYMEFNFQYLAHSLAFVADSNDLFAEVGVQIKLSDSLGVAKLNDAFRLQSPRMRDSIVSDFYDIRRYALDPGKYTLNLTVFDLNTESDPLTAQANINVNDRGNDVHFSDIYLIEYATLAQVNNAFVKSGYEMIPRFSNYYPQDFNYLPFYAEIYNLHFIGDSVSLHEEIVSLDEPGKVMMEKTQMISPDSITPVIRNINLSKLPSGAYDLVLEVRDLDGDVRAKTNFKFDRQNDIEFMTNPDEIVLDPAFEESVDLDSSLYYLAALYPIARQESQRMMKEILRDKDSTLAKKFIQSFWVSTSGTKAYQNWMIYKSQVNLVERLYSTNFQNGFETDRGRVYLQYGPPNSVFERPSTANEYPYEMWRYNEIGRFSNKRFIFYNPDLVNNTYRLLHSDMVGELRNDNWPYMLNSRNNPRGGIDNQNENINDVFGGNSGDFYRQF